MPRRYTASFEKVSCSAVQDLMKLAGGGLVTINRLIRFWLFNTGGAIASPQTLDVRLSLMPITVIVGSGGSAPTPRLTDPGDSLATATVRANDTVKATTSGTKVTIWDGGCYMIQGLDITVPGSPAFGNAESMVLELITSPSGTIVLSGGMEWEETGGVTVP